MPACACFASVAVASPLWQVVHVSAFFGCASSMPRWQMAHWSPRSAAADADVAQTKSAMSPSAARNTFIGSPPRQQNLASRLRDVRDAAHAAERCRHLHALDLFTLDEQWTCSSRSEDREARGRGKHRGLVGRDGET